MTLSELIRAAATEISRGTNPAQYEIVLVTGEDITLKPTVRFDHDNKQIVLGKLGSWNG